MKRTKYYCDRCEKEVHSLLDVIVSRVHLIPDARNPERFHNTEELCRDCLTELNKMLSSFMTDNTHRER